MDANNLTTPNLMDSLYTDWNLFSEKWSKPEGAPFTRTSLLCTSLLSMANTITKIFFTFCSLIPGSDSKSVKDRIDVDAFARDGFESRMKSSKYKSFTAQLILPTLFKFVALTLNPYATVNQPTSSSIAKIPCYSNKLFEMGNDLVKLGMTSEELAENCFDILELVNEEVANDNSEVPEIEISNTEEKLKPLKQWVIKEIGTRATYLAATLSILVEKTIYLAAGVLFAVNAACLGFKYSEVNMLAMKYLGALDVADDVCFGLRSVFYPREYYFDQAQRTMLTAK